jgi:ABC-type transporter MlaC component
MRLYDLRWLSLFGAVSIALSIVLSVLYSSASFAEDQIDPKKSGLGLVSENVGLPKTEKDAIWDLFGALFAKVTQQLTTKQAEYLSDPVAYYEFLADTMLDRWDGASTSRALLGKLNYAKLDEEQRAKLSDMVDQTLIRYAFEGLDNYSGQIFSVADVVVNADKGRGWVQVLVDSPVLPNFNLDLLIKRNLDGQWSAVDVRVKGLTYAKVKKYEYRELFEQRGFEGLIDTLSSKNKTFFLAVCDASEGTSRGRTPC